MITQSAALGCKRKGLGRDRSQHRRRAAADNHKNRKKTHITERSGGREGPWLRHSGSLRRWEDGSGRTLSGQEEEGRRQAVRVQGAGEFLRKFEIKRRWRATGRAGRRMDRTRCGWCIRSAGTGERSVADAERCRRRGCGAAQRAARARLARLRARTYGPARGRARRRDACLTLRGVRYRGRQAVREGGRKCRAGTSWWESAMVRGGQSALVCGWVALFPWALGLAANDPWTP